MITIEEIKNNTFRKATLSGGYRVEDVDAFIDEVIATFEQQKKENIMDHLHIPGSHPSCRHNPDGAYRT